MHRDLCDLGSQIQIRILPEESTLGVHGSSVLTVSLYWFLGLVEFRTAEFNFQDLRNKFHFIFRQVCDEETCIFVVMSIGKKVVWAGGGMSRGH